MIFLKKLKAQSHWKVFIKKEFIIHIEFRKAKEMEGNGKDILVHNIHMFSELCLQEY